MEIDPDLLDFAAGFVGAIEKVVFCGNDHAESAIWRIGGVKTNAYLKQHRQPRKFRNEHDFYVNCMPVLKETVPGLIAVGKDSPSFLILSEVPGKVLEGLEVPEEPLMEIYKRAGAFLRKLHELPYEDKDSLSLGDALILRCERYCRECRNILDASSLDKVAVAVREVAEGEELKRVMCHRDYSPRNWLVSVSGNKLDSFTVIDFEHSQGDFAAVDFQRIVAGYCHNRENLLEAFCKGYGKEEGMKQLQIARKLLGLYALGTIHWAQAHEDADFEKHGREALDIFLTGEG